MLPPSPAPRQNAYPHSAASAVYGVVFRRVAVVGTLVLLVSIGGFHPLAGPMLPLGIITLLAYLAWGITGPLLFTVVLLLRPGELISEQLDVLKLGKITAIACLGFWFFHFFFLKRRHFSRDILSALMLCFTIAIILCSLKTTHSDISVSFLTEVWLKIVLLFYAIANLAGPHSAFRSYVTTAVWLTVILGVFGVHKGLTAAPGDLVEGRVGIGKLLEDPNDYAQMLIAMGLPYIMNCLLLAPKKRIKVIFLIGFLIISSGIYFSKSRGGFLGFAATTLVVVQSRMTTFSLVVVGAAMVGVGTLYFIATRGQDSVTEVDASSQGRLDAWKSATYMFLYNPIFGVGLQCFTPNYLSYAVNPIIWKPMDTHSAWFKIIAELGILGSIFFFPLILFSLIRAHQLEKWARTEQLSAQGYWYTEALLRSIYPALIGWCVSGTFLSNCYSWFLYIQIAILIAGMTLQSNWNTSR